VLVGLVLLMGLTSARRSHAFCRTSACELGDYGTLCTPARDGDCGLPLFWKESCVGFSVQHGGSRDFTSELAGELVSQAFATWESADCDGGRPHVFVQQQPDVVCAAPEYNVDFNVARGNANVVMFRDDDWPYPGLEDGLALTTVTYDTETGEIYDADIELNTFSFLFTTSDTHVYYDLLSTLQHETGHFLGIAHSDDVSAVMHAEPESGTTRHRELTADDVAAICDAYPPEEPPLDATCSPMPHDFSPQCGQSPAPPPASSDRGCSISPAPARSGTPDLLGAAGLIAFAFRRRRRHW
jgi:MYXO-CTERM domain-containing protein